MCQPLKTCLNLTAESDNFFKTIIIEGFMDTNQKQKSGLEDFKSAKAEAKSFALLWVSTFTQFFDYKKGLFIIIMNML